jgi:hypothetical protein
MIDRCVVSPCIWNTRKHECPDMLCFLFIYIDRLSHTRSRDGSIMFQPMAIILIALFIVWTPPKGKLVQRGHSCSKASQCRFTVYQLAQVLCPKGLCRSLEHIWRHICWCFWISYQGNMRNLLFWNAIKYYFVSVILSIVILPWRNMNLPTKSYDSKIVYCLVYVTLELSEMRVQLFTIPSQFWNIWIFRLTSFPVKIIANGIPRTIMKYGLCKYSLEYSTLMIFDTIYRRKYSKLLFSCIFCRRTSNGVNRY